MKFPIRLLVTDLDNTLYDWVSFFVPSFYAMVDEAVRILAVDREQLLDELQRVHREYGTSEQPFALLETETAQRRFSGLSRAQMLSAVDDAFHAFNRVRKEKLRAYPGVLETLQTVSSAGCVIVAHTEAPVSNALFRLKFLSLSPFIKALYAPAMQGPGHPDPSRSQVELPPHYVHVLDAGARKPDPNILAAIMTEYNISPKETLYVGDSISRDIGMAHLAGTRSAFAKYGRSFDPRLWEMLVRVTHWSAADVENDEQLRRTFAGVHAQVELERFDALFESFVFCPATTLRTSS